MDTYLDLSQKFAFGFVAHLSNKYQAMLFSPTNRLPATLAVIFGVVITSWLSNRVNQITHPKAVVLKDALALFFTFLSTILAWLLIAALDDLFAVDIALADQGLLGLYKPVLIIIIIIASFVLIRLASGKYDEQFAAAQTKQS